MIPAPMSAAIAHADPSWHAILQKGLAAVALADPEYLPDLVADAYLPTNGRLLAAFSYPVSEVRYVLVGEGPYPREASATGVCFMDGAVEGLWSDNGLSKTVNRATSLRNFIKMLLVADGTLKPDQTTGAAMADIGCRAKASGSGYIQTLPELQSNLTRHGFLLLNAALVFRPQIRPAAEALAWRPFLTTVLEALASASAMPPTLLLWGKIAGMIGALPGIEPLPKTVAEHPYNLSFIHNPAMHALFGPMDLLRRMN